MTRIVLDQNQARLLAESADPVAVTDEQGNHLGYITHGFTEEELENARRRSKSNQPIYSTQEVFEYLKSLENH